MTVGTGAADDRGPIGVWIWRAGIVGYWRHLDLNYDTSTTHPRSPSAASSRLLCFSHFYVLVDFGQFSSITSGHPHTSLLGYREWRNVIAGRLSDRFSRPPSM